MDLRHKRERLDWGAYEVSLLDPSCGPYWDSDDEHRVESLTCTLDGRTLPYVGMAKAQVAIVFAVCPACGSWMHFQEVRR